MLESLKAFAKRTSLGKMYLRHQFWKWSDRDESACRFYRQFINPGDTVVDVGANRGNRAKLFLHLQAKTVLIEPQTTCADYLKNVLRDKDNWALVEAGLGGEECEKEMLIGSSDVLSTFSTSWLETVKQSGRFGQASWEKRQKVRMTTLDTIIRQYGTPSFIKIDVEGYEQEVLSGLSKPPKALSFEFASEYLVNAFNCMDRLSLLSEFEFQISFGESLKLELPQWLSNTALKEYLLKKETAPHDDHRFFGDIYARKK